ncbi:MAG: M20/M25/M40 family metallo-hydrolase [Lachnospiraceae bacterium]|nr:M20/M25/M40 family metallo-hydrolase [Lachnospiraceae bacterium]
MDNSEMLRELVDLIETDAVSGNERAVAGKLRLALEAMGFRVSMDDAGASFGGNCGNLFAYRDGELPGALLFCAHMDRVPNGCGIKPSVRDGVLYSDGTTILAADDLSGVCSILSGLRILLSDDTPALPRLEVLFTVGEETELWGAKAFDLSQSRAEFCFVFDSAGHVGRFITAAPGICFITGRIRGRSAHAGIAPETGIDAAAALCRMLGTAKTGRLSPSATSNFPYLTTLEPPLNAVCSYAEFRGEARSRDRGELQRYLDDFRAHCEEIAAACGAELDLTMEMSNEAFSIPDDDPILSLCRAACAETDLPFLPEAAGGAMDANVLNARGLKSVGVATGYFDNHSTGEHLILAEFYKAAQLAAALVRAYIKSRSMQIGSSNDSAAVKAQYAVPKGLDTRLTFHEKYSTNRQGYGEWLVSHYDIRDGMTVLEVGCGTGSLWLGHDGIVSKCGKLILTDLSEGMLATAKENLGKRGNIEYRKADIQDLPFPDGSFDAVIANSMLYHVPDLEKGLREVRRVLKKGGVFYCATYGEHNFTDTLAEWFRLGGEDFRPNHNFTMQNGKEILGRFFEKITAVFYEDSLHVTEAEDLETYLRSLASFKAVIDLSVQKIRDILKAHAANGAIDLPKEYGMFLCR